MSSPCYNSFLTTTTTVIDPNVTATKDTSVPNLGSSVGTVVSDTGIVHGSCGQVRIANDDGDVDSDGDVRNSSIGTNFDS